MESSFYVAIQGAAKKGILAVCGENGHIIQVVKSVPLTMRVNPNIKEDLDKALKSLCTKLKMSRRKLMESTGGLCVAMSGVYQKGDIYAVRQLLKSLDLVGSFEPVICEDVWAVLAADKIEEGGVTMASTGSNVFIRSYDGNFVRIGGWGSELADLGSGYHVGKLAINAILDSDDGRRFGSGQLKGAILDSLKLTDVQQLVPWYYAVRKTSRWRSKIADIAIIVTKLAEKENDVVALDIISFASRELINSLSAAIRKSAKEGVIKSTQLKMLIAGGLALGSKHYQTRICQYLQEDHTANVTWTTENARYHPIVGALAFAISGHKNLPKDEQYQELTKSIANFDIDSKGDEQ